ncbi:hypothetical protein NADFUDRAFT_51750 [Nadsonia fulvescens var. elongata DSM 6958]|uniref:Diphthine--ammonia ligase n=1 Tax=Nadsonia fulvescens var. elongata DSM 6958 TaxID=857566 RepID=A0A1E3PIX5_9ASCO|nr:hypothetical protein NADFUDRAFT_51750 [Nadsonia fulvescens var. elongata DSM 6958]
MKTVALISGGKDSFYNILHCIKNGHSLDALANLHPPIDFPSDEMDSHMYQTVGHHVIDHYAELLEVPIFRQAINGSLKNANLSYKPTIDDEAEDLFLLLTKVLQERPDIEAVSVGAILSNYQRTRVENVCQRLGLTCLSYLWHRDQVELLSEMVQSGLDARLIKTAGVGLTTAHLGQSLSQMQPQLLKLYEMYELHPCGEGGEYESLCFDAPIFKYKKLEVVDSKIIEPTSHDCLAYWVPNVFVVSKDSETYDTEWMKSLIVPPMLEEEMEDLIQFVGEADIVDTEEEKEIIENKLQYPISVFSTDNSSCIFNLHCDSSNLSFEEEVEEVLRQLLELTNKIQTISGENLAVISVSLLLSSMDLFPKINSLYAKFFDGIASPPTRLCIATTLPFLRRVQLSATLAPVREHQALRNLYVQSRSYWAPSNIGPYSQAVRLGPICYLSGQIGLNPIDTTLVTDSNVKQGVLAYQNIQRVKSAMNAEKWLAPVAFVTSQKNMKIANGIWSEAGEEFKLITVQVNELPKGAAIEWAGNSLDMSEVLSAQMNADIDDSDLEEETSKYTIKAISWKALDFEEPGSLVWVFSLFVLSVATNDIKVITEKLLGKLSASTGKLTSAIIYTSSFVLQEELDIVFEILKKHCAVEIIPVRRVWNQQMIEKKWGLVFKGTN